MAKPTALDNAKEIAHTFSSHAGDTVDLIRQLQNNKAPAAALGTTIITMQTEQSAPDNKDMRSDDSELGNKLTREEDNITAASNAAKSNSAKLDEVTNKLISHFATEALAAAEASRNIIKHKDDKGPDGKPLYTPKELQGAEITMSGLKQFGAESGVYEFIEYVKANKELPPDVRKAILASGGQEAQTALDQADKAAKEGKFDTKAIEASKALGSRTMEYLLNRNQDDFDIKTYDLEIKNTKAFENDAKTLEWDRNEIEKHLKNGMLGAIVASGGHVPAGMSGASQESPSNSTPASGYEAMRDKLKEINPELANTFQAWAEADRSGNKQAKDKLRELFGAQVNDAIVLAAKDHNDTALSAAKSLFGATVVDNLAHNSRDMGAQYRLAEGARNKILDSKNDPQGQSISASELEGIPPKFKEVITKIEKADSNAARSLLSLYRLSEENDRAQHSNDVGSGNNNMLVNNKNLELSAIAKQLADAGAKDANVKSTVDAFIKEQGVTPTANLEESIKAAAKHAVDVVIPEHHADNTPPAVPPGGKVRTAAAGHGGPNS